MRFKSSVMLLAVIDPYPINARQALMFASKLYAGSEGYFTGELDREATVGLRCSNFGTWSLTWTGTFEDKSFFTGWSCGCWVDARSGEVKQQPNADFRENTETAVN